MKTLPAPGGIFGIMSCSDSPATAARLAEAASLMYSALQVILRTGDLAAVLAVRDLKALEQIQCARDFYATNCLSREAFSPQPANPDRLMRHT